MCFRGTSVRTPELLLNPIDTVGISGSTVCMSGAIWWIMFHSFFVAMSMMLSICCVLLSPGHLSKSSTPDEHPKHEQSTLCCDIHLCWGGSVLFSQIYWLLFCFSVSQCSRFLMFFASMFFYCTFLIFFSGFSVFCFSVQMMLASFEHQEQQRTTATSATARTAVRVVCCLGGGPPPNPSLTYSVAISALRHETVQ